MVIAPIDPTTPPARCHRLIDAVGAKVLLADTPVEAITGTLVLHPLRDGTDLLLREGVRAATGAAAFDFLAIRN